MFNQIRFKWKILLIPVLALFAAAIAVIALTSAINKNDRILHRTLNASIPAWENSRLLIEMMDGIHRGFQNALSIGNPDVLPEVDKQYDQFLAKLRNLESVNALSNEEIQQISSLADEYYKLARPATLRMIQGARGQNTAFELQRMTESYNRIKDRLNQTSQQCQDDIRTGVEGIRSVNQAMLQIVLWGVLGMIIVLFGISLVTISNITKPINMVIGMAERVAQGDLTMEVPLWKGKDESAMLISTFRSMIESLRTLTIQIKEAANSLAAASSEISASVTEIAAGATETATAANETSTTVEEVRQTALDSNRKAKNVSESAQKAVQVSQAGEKSVASTIDGMRQIESQMESIAESIMKLSEHGQAIGGIIATVEDVAEQSNLLAVNASIEAAKAGEHGKGFAVVAHEVKSLAEQSRQATARVRNILDDIQKATSSAV
ncbi:methyl-accepting chemotaxis protein, partial [bacterium]|nr:methyl-accepting chemotaxis protein [bacterium]